MVLDVIVADQLNFFIVFDNTYLQPEQRPCPFIGAYMAPRPSDDFFLIAADFLLFCRPLEWASMDCIEIVQHNNTESSAYKARYGHDFFIIYVGYTQGNIESAKYRFNQEMH